MIHRRLHPSAITTQSYWETEWANQKIPTPIDPANPNPSNHFFQVMDRIFAETFPLAIIDRVRLIEIGCGSSRWLPYFHQRFGFELSGIDYTESGVNAAKAILSKADIPGDIRHGDLFNTPHEWVDHFDIVVSFGLIEHFENPASVIAACARYLRPGGRMFTLVPTMRGLYGLAYRLLRPQIYKLHIPHSKSSLMKAHTAAGLRVSVGGYLLGLPGVISQAEQSSSLVGAIHSLSNLYWRAERAGYGIPPNRFTSPYCYCVADK